MTAGDATTNNHVSLPTGAEAMRERLRALAVEKLAAADVEITQLARLPGHAGIGYSFQLLCPSASVARRLVVRTIPEEVPATGPSDVVRQARIMQSMARAGVPVPEIVWFDGECPILRRPYFVAEFVDGVAIPDDWRAHTAQDRERARAAMRTLARIHAADWRPLQDAWGAPHTLADELDRLLRLVDRPTIDPAWGGRAPLLRARLLTSLPPEPEFGCVHGDFHWGNVIFGTPSVRAVLDWEIAFLGQVLLDLGWISLLADEESFTGAYANRARRFAISPEEMLDIYRACRTLTVADADVRWFRAFSAYRLAVISMFNLMLHRRGKHLDPHWEEIAPSIPQMVERGLEMLR